LVLEIFAQVREQAQVFARVPEIEPVLMLAVAQFARELEPEACPQAASREPSPPSESARETSR
jgi:hypothetical protein